MVCCADSLPRTVNASKASDTQESKASAFNYQPPSGRCDVVVWEMRSLPARRKEQAATIDKDGENSTKWSEEPECQARIEHETHRFYTGKYSLQL